MRAKRRFSQVFVTSTAVALLVSILTAAQAAQRENLSNVRIKNFGCINENFYRGAQPQKRDIADLAAMGIKSVIDLQQDGESGEQGWVENAGMNYFRIGLSDSSSPSSDKAEQFLKLVNDPANQPVFIHCHGGRHRAGAMTAIYRMTHDGWTADRAYQEMKKYEFESGFGHGALRSYVYDFGTNPDLKSIVVRTPK
ncbi:MAG TPA: dual specificity protein phosphatase family protein [Blastocatellia bacterium]|nr:dual specificity protein phosphatase family protein [Blastocatellia bacterium]